jgi:UDP-2-acetamido-3-amino-2,3-dideoxy-glucuronate N-acetyltransferase
MAGHMDKEAKVESDKVGEGCFFWARVHVLPGAVIGNNCKFGENCFVENKVVVGNDVTVKNNVCLWDGVTLEDKVFVGPNVAFTNDMLPRSIGAFTEAELKRTVIQEGASLGANATILCDLVVGEHSFVGAGSVVTRDIYPHEKVYGNPARHQGFVCTCGLDLKRAGESLWDCSCGNSFGELEAGK